MQGGAQEDDIIMANQWFGEFSEKFYEVFFLLCDWRIPSGGLNFGYG